MADPAAPRGRAPKGIAARDDAGLVHLLDRDIERACQTYAAHIEDIAQADHRDATRPRRPG